ncbi:sensor histidine kinase [Haloprofundus salilacus]|uniref:sensor histidine kinase n=1 Tax=Haloprofundus salilacus TaxID=2876190 RepID=UPI001CD00EFB|nr:ATP-binding protein [Haloprofundus salilacus]
MKSVGRTLGYLSIFGFAVVTAAVYALHGLRSSSSVATFIFGTFIPFCVALILFLCGVWLTRQEFDDSNVAKVGFWCAAGVIVTCAIVALMMLYQLSEGVVLSNRDIVFVGGMTSGALVGFLVGVYDVQRRTTETRLATERERTARLNQQLRVLNRVLRHDVRNRSNVILGYADLLTEDDADVEEHARIIKRTALDLASLGDNARRIEHLLSDSEQTIVDLRTLVEQEVTTVRSEHPEARVEIDYGEAGSVQANQLLGVAVNNLLENAIVHNPTERPRVRVTLDLRGDRVFLRVADDGPGIPHDELSVFRSGRETQLTHASGIGLWLVNWIIDDSDGTVDLEERTPRGTMVRVSLPVAEADGADASRLVRG